MFIVFKIFQLVFFLLFSVLKIQVLISKIANLSVLKISTSLWFLVDPVSTVGLTLISDQSMSTI